MAKIRTISKEVNGSYESFILEYRTKYKNFAFKLPGYIETFAAEMELDTRGASEAESTEKLVELIRKFCNVKVTERRVFLVNASWGSRTVERYPDRHNNHWTNEDGKLNLCLQYTEYLQKTVADKSVYYEIREDGEPETYMERGLDDERCVVVDATPENREFLEKLYAALENALRSLRGLIGTEKQLLSAVKKAAQLQLTQG